MEPEPYDICGYSEPIPSSNMSSGYVSIKMTDETISKALHDAISDAALKLLEIVGKYKEESKEDKKIEIEHKEEVEEEEESKEDQENTDTEEEENTEEEEKSEEEEEKKKRKDEERIKAEEEEKKKRMDKERIKEEVDKKKRKDEERIKEVEKIWEEYCVQVSKSNNKIYGFDYFLRLFFAWWKHASMCYLILRKLKSNVDDETVNVIFDQISIPQDKKIDCRTQKDFIIISHDVDIFKVINLHRAPVVFFLDVKDVFTKDVLIEKPIEEHFVGGVFEYEFSSTLKISSAKEQYNLKTLIFLKDGKEKIAKQVQPTIGDCFRLFSYKYDDLIKILEGSFQKYKKQISLRKYYNGVMVAAEKLWCDIHDEPNNIMDGNVTNNQIEINKTVCIPKVKPSKKSNDKGKQRENRRTNRRTKGRITKVETDSNTDGEDVVKTDSNIKYNQIIILLYKKMCTASGFPYLEKKPHRALGYMLLRESICVLSEHIRHTPERISIIFNILKKEAKHKRWFAKISSSEPFFTEDAIQELATILESKENEILEGIEKVINNEINFEDLNDSSHKKIHIQKTFYEPQGLMVVLYIIFKYAADIIQIKEWIVISLYLFLHDFYRFDSNKNQFYNNLILVDFGIMVVFFIMSWFLRFMALRGAVFHTQMRFGKMILPSRLLIETIYVLGVAAFLLYIHIQIPSFDLTHIAVWYIPTRIGLVLGKIFLPMQPLTGTRKECSIIPKFSKIKRAVLQIIFLIVLMGTTAVYDYFLIITNFDVLYYSNFCGDPNYTKDNFLEYFTDFTYLTNTHMLLCNMSLVRVLLVLIAALSISTGLFFIILMSVFGGAIGCMKQGGPRSRITMDKSELYTKIYKRFGIYDLRHQGETIFSNIIWLWCIKVWREQSFISVAEAENLQTNEHLDIAGIHSEVARDVIGFWISSLTTEPIKQLTIDQLPSTSIVIPVYSEKLEFKWEKAPLENPPDEAIYLIRVFKYEYFNFLELMGEKEKEWKILKQDLVNNKNEKEKELEILKQDLVKNINETEILKQDLAKNKNDMEILKKNIKEMKYQMLTDWLSERDQIVYRTVAGAVSYYDAVKFLCVLEGKSEDAEKIAMRKVEVIVTYQKYQENIKNRIILDRWLKKWPCLKVVFNYEANQGIQNVPAELRPQLSHCKFATVCMHYDKELKKIVNVVIPREYPLLIRTITDDKLQGKAMNQSNAMIHARGAFIQALDANQGAVATEYMKHPALLGLFNLDKDKGTVSRPIIGCREYAFTKALSLVGSFHGSQEWSFVTIVLRVFSLLGIRLHYGHPDVFWGQWARYACLSKINANINTSEDVFAGFYVLLSQEGGSKHVEHMQINKGKETGLFQMFGFDFKISQGFSALLRTREIYHIFERLNLQRGILFFYGIAGHFITNTLMVMSLEWYIYALVFYELSGVSLDQIGGTIFGTEWIIHAGCIAAVPLIVENMIEKGPVVGIIHSIGFIIVSTIAFLYQMLTKHSGFIEGMLTGKAAHVDTGRGLDIYRKTMMRLFESYAFSHLFPITEIIGVSLLYIFLANERTGGTLPLIMIWVYIISVVISPQFFNPSLSNSNSFSDLTRDASHYFAWVGSPSSRYSYSEWKKKFDHLHKLDEIPEFSLFCANRDLRILPSFQSSSSLQIIIDFFSNFLFHIIILVFWLIICIYFMYPAIQLWIVFYLTVWTSLTIVHLMMLVSVLFCKVSTLTATTARVVIQAAELGFIIYGFVYYSTQRGVIFSDVFVAFFLFVKLLQSFRGLILMMIPLFFRSVPNHNNRKFHNLHCIILVNLLIQVNIFRAFIAIVWGVIAFIIAFLMRPTWANLMMFGMTELTYDILYKRNGQSEHMVLRNTYDFINQIFKDKNPKIFYHSGKLTSKPHSPVRESIQLMAVGEEEHEKNPSVSIDAILNEI